VGVLSKKEKSLNSELEEKKKIAKRLESEIKEIIKKEAEKNKYARLTPAEKIISEDFAKNRGSLPWPTEQGIITDKFGEHQHAVIQNLTVRNNGIDISSIPNSKVRAIFMGTVSKVFTIKGANTTVIIRHGNFYTVYHNLVNVRVKTGDRVTTKQYIGDIFTDSRNGETVLHFEIWEELDKKNPEEWLSN
jgi:septal ring factor EnvC (AmiA/AmiB activator)